MIHSEGSMLSTAVSSAIAISGCTLLFYALLRHKLIMQGAAASASASPSSKAPPVNMAAKKKVRFSEDMKEPRIKNNEYSSRRRRSSVEMNSNGGKQIRQERERRSVRGALMKADLPANRIVLYDGTYQYRSQMATLMLYAS